MQTQVLRIVERSRFEHQRARLANPHLDGVTVAQQLANVVRNCLSGGIDLRKPKRLLEQGRRHHVEELLDEGELVDAARLDQREEFWAVSLWTERVDALADGRDIDRLNGALNERVDFAHMHPNVAVHRVDVRVNHGDRHRAALGVGLALPHVRAKVHETGLIRFAARRQPNVGDARLWTAVVVRFHAEHEGVWQVGRDLRVMRRAHSVADEELDFALASEHCGVVEVRFSRGETAHVHATELLRAPFERCGEGGRREDTNSNEVTLLDHLHGLGGALHARLVIVAPVFVAAHSVPSFAHASGAGGLWTESCTERTNSRPTPGARATHRSASGRSRACRGCWGGCRP